MPLARKFALLVVCGLALACTACGSKNKDKIVGKWKMVSGPGFDDQKAVLELAKAYVFFDFQADNTLVIGVESTDPEFQQKIGAGGGQTTARCKYKLLSGEGVEFYDLKGMQGQGFFKGDKDRARTNIKIDGDNMTMTDPDGTTGKLVRVKK